MKQKRGLTLSSSTKLTTNLSKGKVLSSSTKLTTNLSKGKVLSLSKGFTLIELLVVISILGILTALLLANFQNARVRARDAARKADLNQVKNALQIYYNDYQGFPDDSGGAIAGCGTGADEVCDWGTEAFSAGSGPTLYMNVLPVDPVDTSPYQYRYNQINSDRYVLYTRLENASDSDFEKSQTRCDPSNTLGFSGTTTYVVCSD